ncbi:hypothetical protein [Virgisporangium aurantiacum]|uniref:Uncharacterized protein n=1 Tax=Virgisporangium aurantiacum TaxID=175570 RepID=A0A8J3Z9Y1_9ACTN|nr:hypothetical protein [Virgisporangium aurantiacum]GIJ60289.1 hypothetical protein Vau01_078050 [Virgisporangium aurantiacum]
MRRTLLGALVALLAGVTAGIVVLPGTSYAASGFTTTAGSFQSSNNVWEAPLPSDWRIGDCTMLGGYTPTGSPFDMRSKARISIPDGSGQTWVYIFEATRTANSPTDVWWTTLRFYTAFGTLILTTPNIPGAQMTRTNQIYLADAGVPVVIDPQLYPLISYVTWSSSC